MDNTRDESDLPTTPNTSPRKKPRPQEPDAPKMSTRRQMIVGGGIIGGVCLMIGGIALYKNSEEIAERWSLESEAKTWRRKKVILPSEIEDYRDFCMRYRREFGKDYDAAK